MVFAMVFSLFMVNNHRDFLNGACVLLHYHCLFSRMMPHISNRFYIHKQIFLTNLPYGIHVAFVIHTSRAIFTLINMSMPFVLASPSLSQ